MLITPKRLEIEGVTLEILKEEDVNYVYNLNNGRMLKTKDDIENYLSQHEWKNSEPMVNFLFQRKKGSWSNLTIMSTIFKATNLKWAMNIVNLINILKLSFLKLLLVNILLLVPFIFKLSSVDIGNSFPNLWVLIPTIVISSIIIAFFHEISHYQAYFSVVKTKRMRIGFSLLYLNIFTFFAELPFLNLLSIEDKKRTILAGVRIQLFINSILILMYIFTGNIYLFFVIIINSYTIFANLSPFSRMDGYWYISNIIGVNSYSEELYLQLSGKKPKTPLVLALGITNIVVIIVGIIITYMGIVKYFF
ncbi:hypothetical protein [Priestia megaterium]|uniref:hypothetical protein n=1 Tax=Priestia megaterium TaxID=1404 RepID=UPI0039A3B723